MENAVGTNHRVRFKVFELDLHTRELYRNGIRLRMQGQPIDVLEMLLERPGELVTREQLRKRLWPEDTFVDFEHSLNSTINRLRDALGDRAEDPKFIETLPRLGYRFVAPVENANGRAPATIDSKTAPYTSLAVAAEVVPISGGTGANPRKWLQWWRWALGAGIVVAVGIAATAWWEWWSVYPVPHVTSIDVITNGGRPTDLLVSDESRVYYDERAKNRLVLAQVSTGGGETTTIPIPLINPAVLDIAPDRSSLLVADWVASPSLWIVPLPQGAPRRVGDLIANDATFTPDGKIIFTRNEEVWITDADSSHARRLWSAPGVPGGASALRVSPDGKRLRLSACEQSGCALWEVKIDGSGAHRVLPRCQNRTRQDGGVWSPDGHYYVFGAVTQKGAFHENLWVLPERRRWFSREPAPVQLTRGPLCFGSRTAFSPDGQTLFAFGMKDSSELVRYDPEKNKVEPFLSGIPATLVNFSRDGQWVVYVTEPYESLWRCRKDGSERVQLTSSDELFAGMARWSPDGSKIVFESISTPSASSKTKLAIVSRDGGKVEQLIPDNEDSHEQSDPTWSPDGNEIIFARNPGQAKVERMERLRVDLRTRKVMPIPGSEGLFSPRWSPDGRYLAAFTIDTRTIRLFDFRRRVWTTWFTAQEGVVGWNLWSPDSRALYFTNDQGKDVPLAWLRIGIGEQRPTKVMDLPDEHVIPGNWYNLGPDGASYFTRDLTSYELYAIHLSEK